MKDVIPGYNERLNFKFYSDDTKKSFENRTTDQSWENDGSIYGSVSMEQTLPRFMNPTIGKIRKYEEQYQPEVVRANELVRRDSPAKAASLRGSRIGSSQYGTDK